MPSRPSPRTWHCPRRPERDGRPGARRPPHPRRPGRPLQRPTRRQSGGRPHRGRRRGSHCAQRPARRVHRADTTRERRTADRQPAHPRRALPVHGDGDHAVTRPIDDAGAHVSAPLPQGDSEPTHGICGRRVPESRASGRSPNPALVRPTASSGPSCCPVRPTWEQRAGLRSSTASTSRSTPRRPR